MVTRYAAKGRGIRELLLPCQDRCRMLDLYLLLAQSDPLATAKGLSEAGIVAILVFFALLFLSAIAWLARSMRQQAQDHQGHYQLLLKNQETKFEQRLKDQQDRDDAHKDELVGILENSLEKSQRTEQVLARATEVIDRAARENTGGA